MKNPWMSLWLSSANTMMNAAQGYAVAHAKQRRGATVFEHHAKRMADLWVSMMIPRPVPIRAVVASPKRRRSR